MRSIHPTFCTAAAAVFLSFPGLAQISQSQVLNGQLQSGSETMFHGYVVALEELAGHHEVARADVDSDGAFRFQNVPYGDYCVKVETYFGDTVQQITYSVNTRNASLVVPLPKQDETRPPSGPVSAARLRHPPAKKAFQAFVAAHKFSQSGRYADAARELERAIQISPDYADAYSNLAVQYIRAGRYEDAVSEIARAMEIGKPNAVDLSNLAYCQSAMGRLDDATQSARAAVRIDPNNLTAHFLLGSLLTRDRRTLSEAIPHLELAADSIPSARANLKRAQAALAEPAPE